MASSWSPAWTGRRMRAAGVGDAPGDGLADPPRGVGRELEPPPGVEPVDGLDQAEVALLDEVEQGQAGRLVLLGDGDDQAQVGADELAVGVVAGDRRRLLELLLGRDGRARRPGPAWPPPPARPA